VIAQWGSYPNFQKHELDCRETGENEMQHEFMEKLQRLRSIYGKPLRITSGFRSVKHSIEAKKVVPGVHTLGVACDIGCQGVEAHRILSLALELGFTGIGVQQKGEGRFLHLDTGPTRIWSY